MKKLLTIVALLLAAVQSYAQSASVGAAGALIPRSVNCATTTYGQIVGTGNPLGKPSANSGFTGTLPASNYYVVVTFYDFVGHETQTSPETTVQLLSTGNILIGPPASGVPSTAMGMRVYVGTTTGSETLQGSTVGPLFYHQSIPLVSGAAPPTTNNTICKIAANDAMWPLGTGYTVALTDTNGNSLPGYPMQWQLMGPGSTVNITSGIPYYNGVVMFPSPILANPLNRAAQFVNGPLTINGNFNVNGAYLQNGQPFNGGGSAIVLTTNGTNNLSQTSLNFQDGTGTTVSNPSAGNEQVNVTYGTTAGTAAQGNDSRFNNAITCVGCGANNDFVRSTATGQVTASGVLVYDPTNTAIKENAAVMADWINPVGKAVPFNSVVTAGLLAKISANGVFDPVSGADGPDTPTFVVVVAASAPAQKGYVATAGGSQAVCYTDNATTLGDYLAANYDGGLGTSTCHSIGATLPTTCTWVVGQSTSTGTATNLPITVIGQWYGCSGTSGTLTGTMTAGTVPVGISAGVLGPSLETEANSTFISAQTNGISATQVVTSGSLSQTLMYSVPNDGSTGTTVYLLAKITANTAIKAATTDTAVKLYPVAASVSSNGTTYAAGTTGNPPLVTRGQAVVTADAGGVSADHYVGASTATDAKVMDLGAGPILTNAARCLGQANTGAITASTTGTIDYGNCPVLVGPLPFASLPACGATYEGIAVAVSDANQNTWGTTITAGSSTGHVLAFCDGTNWTVGAK